MTSKIANKFSPEVRTRAVRMVSDHEGEHASRWAAVVSIASKIGCTPQTLHEWVKKTEIDSGKRSGVPSDISDRLKALERENRESSGKSTWRSSSAPTKQRALRSCPSDGSWSAPSLGSTAAAAWSRIGSASTERHWRSCASLQSASC